MLNYRPCSRVNKAAITDADNFLYCLNCLCLNFFVVKLNGILPLSEANTFRIKEHFVIDHLVNNFVELLVRSETRRQSFLHRVPYLLQCARHVKENSINNTFRLDDQV